MVLVSSDNCIQQKVFGRYKTSSLRCKKVKVVVVIVNQKKTLGKKCPFFCKNH